MSTLQDFLNHPIETLERALHIRKQIAALEKALQEVMGSASSSLRAMQTTITGKAKRGRRKKMSAAARAKIAAAQRARWAKHKGTTPIEGPAPKAKKKKRGGMSAEGRARIIAAQKARWAKVKAWKSTTTKT